ncbi:hypothetical protein CsSME_00050704 [Camellia sinensis var. sinensis]
MATLSIPLYLPFSGGKEEGVSVLEGGVDGYGLLNIVWQMKRDFVKTKEELCIEYKEGGRNKGGGGVVAGFCKDHTELWKKQQQTGKFKIVARDEHKK